MPVYALAIDVGASGGRHILGCVRDGRLALEEVYRFPNGMAERNGRLCWDVEALRGHMLEGMRRCKATGRVPASVGVDTWGVDYVLVDRQGRRVGDCAAYRDGRTAPVLNALPDGWLYRRTGIAKQPFNTVYQLMATPKEDLARADRCLLMPDYLHFLLSGVKANEFTDASTGALLNAETRSWDREVLAAAGIPARLFPEPPVKPGTRLGPLLPEIVESAGFPCEVVLPATHDTGSAFQAAPARDDHAATLSSGTWSLLGVENDRPVLSEAARAAGFTNEGGYGGTVRFLRNIMGLWMLQRIRGELGGDRSYAELAALAEEGAAYGPIVDVSDNRFLAPASMTGEVRAALAEAGAPAPAGLPELLRCVLHSLAAGYASGVRALETLTGRRFTSLNVVGGGSRNRVLNQWTADETGLTVYAGPREGTALGNAVAQLIALGEIDGLARARAMIRGSFEVETYQPRKGA